MWLRLRFLGRVVLLLLLLLIEAVSPAVGDVDAEEVLTRSAFFLRAVMRGNGGSDQRL